MKQCTKCHKMKVLEDFGTFRNGPRFGYRNVCKVCHYEQSRNWARRHSDRVRKYNREWRQDKRRNFKFYLRDLDNHYRSTYGISLKQVHKLLVHQGNMCAVCGEIFQSNYEVDHCHNTGKIRGLVCRACNAAIGRYENGTRIYRVSQSIIEKYLQKEVMT